MNDNSESIALRVTVIGGQRYDDDYQVIWCGLSIGRIMKSSGVPSHVDQWWWGSNVYGKPSLGGDSGHDTDLEDCKVQFPQGQLFDLMALSPFAPMRRLNVDAPFI
jgi:hypothetical protein